ncbi:hypothetical protein NQ315_002445 [Exocentrus adspersus]|uniref:EB domain-containing protein n=1 Tax=Exocentrus adspersus TaxID=1586481 RepID=A0AAV8VI49_9CUCU|nr:hypothetical protein NQ315_002445 [Exocentrus adspersus]
MRPDDESVINVPPPDFGGFRSELNQSCNIDEECAYVKFAKCINSKCNCMERYVASTTGSRCLPIAEEYRSQCVDNSQCMETLGHGSECLNGYCDCREIYQFRKKINKCVMDICKASYSIIVKLIFGISFKILKVGIPLLYFYAKT